MIDSRKRFEIDFIGTWLYSAIRQHEPERKILDKYKSKYSKNYWYCMCEGNYWEKVEPDKAINWFKRSYQLANSDNRKLYVFKPYGFYGVQ